MQDNIPVKRYRKNKHDQIKKGILHIFLRDGYSGASVDEICDYAGVSKATLYRYYPEKSIMFKEALNVAIGLALAGQPNNKYPSNNPKKFFPIILSDLIDWLTSSNNSSFLRLITAESTRFSEECNKCLHIIITCCTSLLKSFIDKWIDQGLIIKHDACNSSLEIASMIIFKCQNFSTYTDIYKTGDCRAEISNSAADLFMNAYRIK